MEDVGNSHFLVKLFGRLQYALVFMIKLQFIIFTNTFEGTFNFQQFHENVKT